MVEGVFVFSVQWVSTGVRCLVACMAVVLMGDIGVYVGGLMEDGNDGVRGGVCVWVRVIEIPR
jgi:hypothetical protein